MEENQEVVLSVRAYKLLTALNGFNEEVMETFRVKMGKKNPIPVR